MEQFLQVLDQKQQEVSCKVWTHLNEGIGIPCAGQIKASCSELLCLNDPRLSEVVENLGLAEPTGSRHFKKEQMLVKSLIGT